MHHRPRAESGQIPVLILVLLPVLLTQGDRCRSVSLGTLQQSGNQAAKTDTWMTLSVMDADGVRPTERGVKRPLNQRVGGSSPPRPTNPFGEFQNIGAPRNRLMG